jgi:predicted metal-binding protein
MDYNNIEELAISCGFSNVGKLDSDTIRVREEVRDSCAENKCHAYGTNWSCPPACGDLNECEALIKKYKNGLILQTTGDIEDSFDFEAMADLEKAHSKSLKKFAVELKKLYPDALIIGTGACTVCKECAYPDDPCRFPEQMMSSMEALGMVVSDVCKANDIPYYYGPGTLTYVGCVLID